MNNGEVMNRNNATKVAAKILSAAICLVLIVMAPAALAVTKANFDKVRATFQWENAATLVPNLKCDDCAQQINVGFDFPFAGEQFNKVWVSSNGVLSLLDPMTEYYNTKLPTRGKERRTSALIMPYWDDLNPRAGGLITYATLGSAPNRRLIVSWNNVPHYWKVGEYNFQAILYETGEIKFQYGKGDADGSSATVGIEVANDDYIQHSYNQNVIKAKDAWLFRPQPYVQSVIQPCGSLNSLMVQYSYPMDAGSAAQKQNYDFVSTSTPGLNVTSASLSPDGYTVTLGLNKSLQAGVPYQLRIRDVLSLAGRAINPNHTTRPISGSSGLIGTYYSQYGIQRAYHTGPWVQRNDAQVDFSWNNAAPDILPRGDDFSIRWKGYLIPTRTGSYVFRTYSDDGIRLWVNGVKILDAWNDHAPRYDNSSAVSLNAGEAVPIVLEHYERGGKAYARLYWDEPDGTSGNYALIPPSALSPCLPLTGPDHIRIAHDGNGLTCQAERITLKACADAACGTEYAGDVTVNLVANNGGAWSPNPVTFNGHTDVQLSKTTPGDTTLSIASATPPAVNDWDCVVNGDLVSQTDCKVNFADTGFIFTEAVNGPEASVANQTAGTVFGPYWLRAVKTGTTTKACEAAITGSRDVHFNYVCIDPSSCSSGSHMTIGGQDVQSTGTHLNLMFDSNGNASLGSVVYEDVGKIRLDARATVDNNGTPVTLTGSLKGPAGFFVVRPDHFMLSDIQCADGTPNPDPPASDASGPGFCKAGQNFNVTVTALSSTGHATPNFGKEATPESVKLRSELVAPSDGADGFPPGGMAAFGPFNGGEASGNFHWDEVGIITLTPHIADDDGYLGTGDVSGVTSGNVGRFYPDHFKLSSGSINPACGTSGFSYMDQSFTVKYKVEALNASNGTTRNYDGEFAKETTVTIKAEENGSDLSSRLTVQSGNWIDGEYSVTDSTAKFSRSSTVDGSFDVLRIGISLSDPDESQLLELDMLNNTAKAIGQTRMRFGRLVLDSAYGSEFANLSMPVRAEYYDGSGWRINTEDSCATVSASDLTEEDIDSSDTLLPDHVTPSGGGALSAGHSSFTLSAPGAGHTGSLGYRLSVPSWLQFDWEEVGGFDENPFALATFGVYQGNPSIIYQREVWVQ